MRRVIPGVVLAACMAAGTASAIPSGPVAFSATRIERVPEGELRRNKVYVSNGWMRMEWPKSPFPGETAPMMVALKLLGSSQKTVLDSEERTAMELEDPNTWPWPDIAWWMVVRGESPCTGRPELSCERLGTERVGGSSTQKWRLVPQAPHRPWAAVTVWVAPELGGIIVRTEEPAGVRTELTDIHLGPQPYSLFQIPAGYTKVSGLAREGSGPPP